MWPSHSLLESFMFSSKTRLWEMADGVPTSPILTVSTLSTHHPLGPPPSLPCVVQGQTPRTLSYLPVPEPGSPSPGYPNLLRDSCWKQNPHHPRQCLGDFSLERERETVSRLFPLWSHIRLSRSHLNTAWNFAAVTQRMLIWIKSHALTLYCSNVTRANTNTQKSL